MLSPTYIPNLDAILHGGLMQGSSMLIAGPTGSGRTLTCLQSLFTAAKAGEKCIYITVLSEPPDKLLHIAQNYSFFDDGPLKCGKLKFLELDREILTKGDYAILKYFHTLAHDNPNRVVIDPATVLLCISPSFEDGRELLPLEKRAFFVNLFRAFAASDTLLMMTGDLTGSEINTSILSHLSDVVIELGNHDKNDHDEQRYIRVIKSRGKDFVAGKHDLKISLDGATISSRGPP
ncbi:ATPase domain-containing protein [uncultured Methanomethylovorans sp.]|uniref:RAD55 family ATPase n=1 Tax=uncultured Methanomethylovorans sp. TaxID=183759 RepID=UPI00260A3A13|nr:ATPase domain-containing protein [uncultured Methanomethylovorans sp.]